MDNSKQKPALQNSLAPLYALRDISQRVLPADHRCQMCEQVPNYYCQKTGEHGGVAKRKDGTHTLYGLGSCGDVRACPVCGNKVGLQRADEVKRVLAWHRANNGIAVLVTMTCRHTKTDVLSDILKSLSQAKRDFASYSAVKNCKKLLGYTNVISARDLTYSDNNGFHPHYHDIYLIQSDFHSISYFKALNPKLQSFAIKNDLTSKGNKNLCLTKIRSFLANQWIVACVKNDMAPPTNERGFDIQWRKSDGTDAVGSYLVKWAYELSTPNKKVGKNGSITPLQILQRVYTSDGEFVYKYAKLWREYNEAYKGLSSLYFGKGLKDAVGINEETDEELADKPTNVIVRKFTHDERKAVVYYKRQRDVVRYFDNYSYEVADAYLLQLTTNYLNERRSRENMRINLKRKIAEYTAERMATLWLEEAA